MGGQTSKQALDKHQQELAKQAQDIFKQTNFDRVEARKLYSAFEKHAGKDGTVDKKAFRAALAELDDFGLKDDVPFIDRLFDLFDINKDGRVDMKEFVTGLSLVCNGTVEEKVELTFNAYDKDDSGSITKDEMVEMFKNTYASALHTLQAASGAKGFDEDFLNEFVVKFQEMITQWIDSMWDQWDKNKDGKLSLEEFKQYVTSEPYVAATLNGMRAEVPMAFK